MKKTNYQIRTALSKEETLAALAEITDSKANMVKAIKGMTESRFVGELKSDSFHIENYESPPCEFKGTVKEENGTTTIDIRVIHKSISNSSLFGFYALLYPIIAVAFIIFLALNPTNIFLWVLAILTFLILWAITKFLNWFNRQGDPNPTRSIAAIQKQVKGQLS